MSDPSTAVVGGAPAHAAHPKTNYIKIWAILVGLLVVSVLGPMIGIRAVTLVTAFGIALVKAYLVAKNFMHIDIERRFVVYMVLTMLVIMFVFVGGVSPDVMKHEGTRWHNVAADAEVERGLKEPVSEHGEGFHEKGELPEPAEKH